MIFMWEVLVSNIKSDSFCRMSSDILSEELGSNLGRGYNLDQILLV